MEAFTNINPHEVSSTLLYNITSKDVEINMGCKSYRGWVQSIDPITRSIFLMKFSEQNTCSELMLIPGYNIKFIKVFKGSSTQAMISLMDSIFKKKEIYFSKEELNSRRDALCVWLSGNRVPFIVTDNLGIEVLHVATIKPPYCTESIHCKNEVVLDKVIKLVKTAPGLHNKDEHQD